MDTSTNVHDNAYFELAGKVQIAISAFIQHHWISLNRSFSVNNNQIVYHVFDVLDTKFPHVRHH